MPTLARCLIVLFACGAVAPALADEVAPAAGGSDRDLQYEDRIAELERTVQVLAEELERTRTELAVPDEPESLTSVYGMGPGASKVYQSSRGLSIGGYGEGLYTNFVSDDDADDLDRADWLRAVLYVGYKFTDRIVFNSEIEFEHATTSKGGSVSVELATLDFFWRDEMNFRAGLLLMPMGFLNEIHEPPFYYGTHRPDVERAIIPSTWRENGTGIFGSLGEQVEYKLYVTNGFDAEGFSASGLRDGRQSGSQALAEQLAFTGRLDWTPLPELLLGASFYTGNSGQNQRVAGVKLPDTRTTLFDVHAQYRWRGLFLRALYTMAFVGDADELSRALGLDPTDPDDADQGVAKRMLGGYAEIAYDVMQWLSEGSERTLEPFYRFEWYDTQSEVPSAWVENRGKEIRVQTVGLQFRPIPNVVLKADYRNRWARRGQLADEVNLGVGYVF
jgi:hypothetical protein